MLPLVKSFVNRLLFTVFSLISFYNYVQYTTERLHFAREKTGQKLARSNKQNQDAWCCACKRRIVGKYTIKSVAMERIHPMGQIR